MNNMPFPYFQGPYQPPTPKENLEEEIRKLKLEIAKLKERIAAIENKNTNNYLQNDDKLYMMWTQMCSFFVDNYLLWYTNNRRKWGTVNAKITKHW